MQARTLAYRAGVSEVESREILRRLTAAYPNYTDWARSMTDTGLLGGRLATVFGWQLHAGPATRATSLRNYPMQANGAEMLRLACCLATEAGVTVCAPVHDALLVEAGTDAINETIAATRTAMAEASRVVLDGLEIGTDAEIVDWPDRYADPRGAAMWDIVTGLLQVSDGQFAR
jgi:DNA polymerase I-like protein with 3'-5' exonuclease and polymerase domains